MDSDQDAEISSGIGSVVAAVDLFPQGEAVIGRAVQIATAQRASLTVVHVLDIAGWDAVVGDPASIRQEAEDAARARIAAAFNRLGADASHATVLIERGPPSLRLIKLCEDLRADLIVMRAHERERIIDKMIGSTTDRVIRAAPAPVLVVKRPSERPYRRVLVAADVSDDAPRMVSFVADMLPGAKLHLVHAVQIPPQLEQAMLSVGTNHATLAAHLDALKRNALHRLRALAARAVGRVAPVTTRVMVGEPGAALARATRSPRVDMIALGPGCTSLIRRAFIGSATRRVLRDASCDVLVCHPPSPAIGQSHSASTSVAIEK